MTAPGTYFWKKAPFVKLLSGMIAGILLQWNLQAAVNTWWIILTTSMVAVPGFFLIPLFNRFKFFFIPGIAATSLFVSIGALLAWQKDIRNDPGWLGKYYTGNETLVASLSEPLSEKTNSYKAIATVNYLMQNNESIPVNGNLVIYFKKDPSIPKMGYGSTILFKKQIQEIRNPGNPGGFDYKRYALFHGITHQVFLKPGEYVWLEEKKENWFRKFIYRSRERILNIIKRNMAGEKERGLAEALLIGYKDDLDQRLVQSYTNTGVVHIIAISGLHLGLIYWLLVRIFKPLQKKMSAGYGKKLKWIRPFFIITGLWLFSFMAGAQPSVLRSALMFTCIVLGEWLGKRGSIINTLALSAFILLCINPYWLWDAGFQLSYTAVLSIIIFMRPIYNWFYIKNKILDFIWKLNAVTLAAQILTVPLSIYHFHQFPNYFLLTNFIAVPLSGIIVLGEILLCVVAWVPAVALFAGKLLSWTIWLMNTWIERIESLPFSLWDSLQISIMQAILIILFIVCISCWLMEKAKRWLVPGLLGLLGFIIIRSLSFIRAEQQQKIIVYNIPKQKAIDFIDGRKSLFKGDPGLAKDDFAGNFYRKPSGIFFRTTPADSLECFRQNGNYIQFVNKKIILVDTSIRFQKTNYKPAIDLLVISKNPRLDMTRLADAMNIKQVVFDSSVPVWKTSILKKVCDSLRIPYYDVSVKGAFVMNLR